MNQHFQAQRFKLTREELQERRKILLTGAPCGPIRPLSPGIPLGPLKKEQKVHYSGGHHVRIKKGLFFSPLQE